MRKNIVNGSKYIYFILFFVILFLSIGYASFDAVLEITDASAIVRVEKNVRISALQVDSVASLAETTYTDYNVNRMLVGVKLSNVDSSVKYKIEVTNLGSAEIVISNIVGLPSNIEYELQDYILDEKICDDNGNCTLGIVKEFYVTIKYAQDGYDLINTEYNLNLEFVFEEYVTSSITYDYNYLPDNQFENYYNTEEFRSCCESGDYFISTGRTISTDGIHYTAVRYPSFTDEWDRGYFFSNKVETPLVDGIDYTLIFDAMGSETFTAIIGSEQGGEKSFTINTEWTRYTYTFTAKTSSSLLLAFVVYDWGGTNQRTLDLRNIQLQSGGVELYTKGYSYRANREFGENLPNPTRDGCLFLGWFTDPVNGVQITSSTLVPNESVTYYAHWSCSY